MSEGIFAQAITRADQILENLSAPHAEGPTKGRNIINSEDYIWISAFVLGRSGLSNNASALVKLAESDPLAHDALCLGISYRLEQGQEIDLNAREWLVAYLRGERARPKAKGGRNRQNGRDFVLWQTVTCLCAEFASLSVTRGDNNMPLSICDAVAEAMMRRHIKPSSYQIVKDAYYKIK